MPRSSTKAGPPPDPVTQYALDVVEGRLVTGELVRRACERHLRDLERAEEKGWRWDTESALRPVEFAAEFCVHAEGDFAGEPVVLEPWQVFIVGCLFGWLRRGKRDRWVRRFRKALIAVARKNGKSTFVAVIGLYLLVADDEPAAQVFSAATKLKQAQIVLKAARRMVKASPELRQYIRVKRNELVVEDTDSEFTALGRDSDRQDGLNPHAALIDELHAHPDGGVYEVLDSGMGARRQPIVIAITTAGFNPEGFGAKEWQYVVSVLEGRIENDAYFGYIACLDPVDDPFDEKNWVKANPNLEVSVQLSHIQEQALLAKTAPHHRNSFFHKHLNLWVNSADAWMPLDVWDAAAGQAKTLDELEGRECFLSYDLSHRQDLSAVVLLFPPSSSDPKWRILPYYWMPEDGLADRAKDDKVDYVGWAAKDLLYTCPGPTVDQEMIEEFIFGLRDRVNIIEVPHDPAQAYRVNTNLGKAGLVMVPVRQWLVTLSEPMKFLGELVVTKQIEHGGHPILRWNLSNTRVKQDDNDLIRPIKPRDRRKRIDGIAAAVTAMSRAMLDRDTLPSSETVTAETDGKKVRVY